MAGQLQAEVEIMFAFLDQRFEGVELFRPADFLAILRLLGVYDVGRKPDGTPLEVPPHLLEARESGDVGPFRGRVSDEDAMRRVVVTGIGCINPMGHDVETVWSGLKEGKSGVGYTTIFDASTFPTRISAEVRNWDVSRIGEDLTVWKNRGRHTCFAAGAARQAVDSSGDARLAIWIPNGSVCTWAAAKAVRISFPSPT